MLTSMRRTKTTVTDSYAAAFAQSGGLARAAKLSKARKSEIAKAAAAARWAGHTPKRKRARKTA